VIRKVLATRNQPNVLLALMVFDLLVNAVAPRQMIEEHFDRMRFEPWVRRSVFPVKLAGTLGVLLGRRYPRLGAFTAACFVAYFAIAVGYHRRVDDGIVLTGPAVIFGGVAARSLVAGLAAAR
jgi:hypothetical protein